MPAAGNPPASFTSTFNMRSYSHFRKVVALVLFVFVAFNIAMARWSPRLPFRKKVREVCSAWNANVVFIGNSLLDNHIDPLVFERMARDHGDALVPVNAALSASIPPDQFLMYRLAIHTSIPRIVVIGFFDFQLTHQERLQVSDLVGNRALSFDPAVPTADVQTIYRFSPPEEIKFRVFRTLPCLAYRSNAWQYIELLRRKLAAVGMPNEGGNNEFGRIADFSALEASSVGNFETEANNFVNHPDRLNRANELILDQARARGIPVIFLLMPISPYHRSVYYGDSAWGRYLAALRSVLASKGGTLVDGSSWFPDGNNFADRLHLKVTERGPLTVKVATVVMDNLSGTRSAK
jgi:hypothetical protein